MLLVRRTGEDGPRAGAAIPAAREAEQAAPDQVRGEVLLGDGDLARSPAVAELVQQRQDGAVEDGVEREVGEEPVERGVRTRAVEALERLAQLEGRTVRLGRSGLLLGLAQRHARRLGRGEPRPEELAHPQNSVHVARRIEAVAGSRPER